MYEKDLAKLLEGPETFLQYNYYLDKFSKYAETDDSWKSALEREIPLLIIEMFDAGIEFKGFALALYQNIFTSQFKDNYTNYFDLVSKIVMIELGLDCYLKRISFEQGIDKMILQTRKLLLQEKEELVFDPGFDFQALN
jgi:hypothetical protein